MPYPFFTREIGPAEALYAEELDFSRYIWLHKPRRRDKKKPALNTGGPKVFSIHGIVTWEVTLELQQVPGL